jgi:hypothetical protein
MVNARIVVTPLFQMTFQFPKPFLVIQSAPHKPLSWFRFIDDVDMKWTESEENLNRFFDHANNVDNQWCLSNVRVTLLHEVEGGN